ncbi:Na/Pi cotransporter family protein [Lysinibacillus piscis]|uniref:Phosphate:sodium symporter n=1 Tax=Lysinibacillus piscis TaxID=2518931 RepID=A0ABQ5NP59_9BACI|nr:Na/Pi symporter [Lysinibacillus sp. KH24]GLC89779.1 phosphate:sodium symporter [Lysinibacillus sp. KH24]
MINVLGGIGLFLLGMTMLTNGLKELAGDALKKWLNRFTGGTISSVLSGTLMTMLVQSSTATTLITIGFVSAGLLTFIQSIGVIIGANIGSTSTGWIISLIGFKVNMQTMSLPFIALGVFIQLLAPRDIKAVGGLFTGFGLLFLGIDVLQGGMATVQDKIPFDSFQANTISGKLILIALGLVMTVIMQASSAAIAATLTALYAGAIDFEQAVYLVIGQNIGTTATALFAAIGASTAAKRTAMTHVLFNVATAIIVTLGAAWMLSLTKLVTTIINGSFDETLGIAVFHTLFSVIGAIIFVPFVKPFARMIERLIHEKGNHLTRNLDDNVAKIPGVAVEVSFNTLQDITKELTTVIVALIQGKKMTAELEGKLAQIDEAINKTRLFMDAIQSTSTKDRYKHIALLHALDHLYRLAKALHEQQPSTFQLQEALTQKWLDVLEKVIAIIDEDVRLPEIAMMLKQTSVEMAVERRNKRDAYFKNSVANVVDLELANAKVEALLWLDRLVYHYWRTSARLAEYQTGKDNQLEAAE